LDSAGKAWQIVVGFRYADEYHRVIACATRIKKFKQKRVGLPTTR